MSDRWAFYFTELDGAYASVLVDLGQCDTAPDETRPWLLWIWIRLRQPRADGLWRDEEGDILEEIEESVIEAVKKTTGAETVGHVTTVGRREIYFYGSRQDRFDEAIKHALKCFPDYEFTTGTKKDTGWSHYFEVLCPSPEEALRMNNSNLIDVFEEDGDILTKPRPVNYCIFFKSKKDRAWYASKAISGGFTIAEESEVDEDIETDTPYRLVLERVSPIDLESINAITLDLFRLAQQVDADYDGWEASVEKSE